MQTHDSLILSWCSEVFQPVDATLVAQNQPQWEYLYHENGKRNKSVATLPRATVKHLAASLCLWWFAIVFDHLTVPSGTLNFSEGDR